MTTATRALALFLALLGFLFFAAPASADHIWKGPAAHVVQPQDSCFFAPDCPPMAC